MEIVSLKVPFAPRKLGYMWLAPSDFPKENLVNISSAPMWHTHVSRFVMSKTWRGAYLLLQYSEVEGIFAFTVEADATFKAFGNLQAGHQIKNCLWMLDWLEFLIHVLLERMLITILYLWHLVFFFFTFIYVYWKSTRMFELLWHVTSVCCSSKSVVLFPLLSAWKSNLDFT